MRRLAATALALTLTLTLAAPTAAHETTSYGDLRGVMEEAWKDLNEAFRDSGAFESVTDPAFRESLEERVPRMRDALLGVVPDPCYQELYAELWVMYADLRHLQRALEDSSAEEMVDLLTLLIEADGTAMAAEAMDATGCG